ncbi:MmyB family transcriptional regulator [Streptomyces griseofuscus]|uniref:MmyB-like transcription regulator ligand binding domain-containing protein n=1 Tax=Streptomyces griseofuscus TaxID=146922 RepID=A0A3R8QAZ9_9ACTN|nr:hypothetical protein [Streptomyces griseofuscus]RRQ79193.1 hypothetical protein CQW44_35165 [Streptomyces griseofuscus]
MRPAPTPRVRPGSLRVLDPTAHDILAAWEAAARSTTAAPSLYAGRHPHDARLAELIGELCVRDEGFRQRWADRDVLEHTHGTKFYRHPLVGELTFEYESLTLPDDAGQALCLYTAQPDSPSDHALCLLAGGSAPAHRAEDRACSSSPSSP